ncbi:TldD/PmbA family protein [Pontibacter harenae]|uniref:TldD/PmbA family protein n=1 Tax=Pontibacter harenae TaxID=2894083 RepID=UPI001E52F59F|nr:TldD/PmbA family protein [Pontibacter harenae]MCC9169025.1 TldD/PmbA family protein [Pontibacter harenae]
MKRRDFLHLTGLGVGASMLASIPLLGNDIPFEDALTPVDTVLKKQLADVALNAARANGASYADVRIGRYLNQFITTRENKVENISNTESFGVGIRVLVNGCWGFVATDNLDKENVAKAAKQAVTLAKVNSKLMDEPVQLAPQKGYGEVSWKTPIEINGFEVPVKEKVELLLAVNNEGIKGGANFANSSLFLINEQKYFASTEGSYIEQDIHRLWPTFTVTKTDPKTGRFVSRNALSAPIGKGYEYLVPREEEKVRGVVTTYKKRYDMLEDAREAADNLAEKLKAKPVAPGKYDLVLDPSQLFLTIHESVGHPTELDRVLGYEANMAGTSFLTLDKLKSRQFEYGSPIVNLVADKTQPDTLGAVGYDDEGVKCKQWDIVKNGVLVDLQATRDQAHMIGRNESHGCSYAQSWEDVQFQRMPNVSLQPGKAKMSAADLIKDVEKGIYMLGRNTSSIDHQRYNFQFSSQLCYEIKNGGIVGMLSNAAYQSNTQEFWNSCAALGDKDDYRLGGTFFDGKGEPGQSSAVSHGCPTTRFNGINVINTGRKIS